MGCVPDRMDVRDVVGRADRCGRGRSPRLRGGHTPFGRPRAPRAEPQPGVRAVRQDDLRVHVRRPHATTDDRRVRQALQFAVDRARIVVRCRLRLLAITCQVLPPDFPSHRPYCPYTIDPDAERNVVGSRLGEARRLVATSGTRGASISIFAPASRWPPLERCLGRSRARVPAVAPPLRARPVLDGCYYPTTATRSGSWVGRPIPSPSGFIPPLFTCGESRPGNVSHFCDPAVERAMHRAVVLQSTTRLQRTPRGPTSTGW